MWPRRKTAIRNDIGPVGRHVLLMLFALGLLTVACNLTDGRQPMVSPPQIEQASTAEQLPSPQVLPTTVTSQAPTADTVPGETNVPAPIPPTAAPQATSTLPAVQPPSPETQPSPAGVELLQPGQSDTNNLAEDEMRLYPFEGISFEPLLFFVEGDADLDLVLAVYEGAQTHGDLATLTPMSETDLSPAGRPELLVFTPDDDGIYTIAVQAKDQSAGQFTLYLYDSSTAATGAQLASDNIAAGQSGTYPAQSAGGRPVIVFVDPASQEDLAIEVSDASGSVVITADYGRGGSAEALYLLPLQTTSYIVTIREAGGAAAAFNLVIISLS